MKILVHGDINYSIFKSYVEFGKKIKFRCAVNGTSSSMFVRKNYKYCDIKYIGIGICPMFYRNDGKTSNVDRSDEGWTSIYGKYVIASDSMNHTMFVCRYNELAWKYLCKMCFNTANKIMGEDEYEDFLKDRIIIERQTEKDNNYDDIVGQYDGFVN